MLTEVSKVLKRSQKDCNKSQALQRSYSSLSDINYSTGNQSINKDFLIQILFPLFGENNQIFFDLGGIFPLILAGWGGGGWGGRSVDYDYRIYCFEIGKMVVYREHICPT